jgi:phosphohistidine phosphatase SixA
MQDSGVVRQIQGRQTEVVTLHLVRHADAGTRRGWKADDRLRPLSASGELQAHSIAAQLSTRTVSRIMASPAVRCVQTVDPLASQLGMVVETAETLYEENPVHPLLELLEGLEDDTVLCSHGDMIPYVIHHLEAAGIELSGPPVCQKGSVWSLTREGDRFVRADYTPAP